jgi:hypothetical protein
MDNFYMKRQILLIILLAVMTFSAFACDCTRNSNLKEAQKASFEESDLVFIGEVVSIGENLKYKYKGWFDNRIFEIEVTEGFKGATIGDILKGRSLTSCSTAPEPGIWLIYANIDEEGFMTFSYCGLSRAFNKPERINFDGYTVRPPTIEELENPQPDDDLDWAVELATIKLQAANHLKEEVLWLRSLK